MATLLSAQCTDKRVNKTTEKLFKKYRTAEDYAFSPEGELEEAIKNINFFRTKALNIRATAKRIIDEYDGKVPGTLGALTSLRGVGRKTANVLLGCGFGKDALPVDTHVLRVATRLGLAEKKDPDKVEMELTAIIEKGRWTEAGNLLIIHGRRICKARKPLCTECVVNGYCDFFKREGIPN